MNLKSLINNRQNRVRDGQLCEELAYAFSPRPASSASKKLISLGVLWMTPQSSFEQWRSIWGTMWLHFQHTLCSWDCGCVVEISRFKIIEFVNGTAAGRKIVIVRTCLDNVGIKNCLFIMGLLRAIANWREAEEAAAFENMITVNGEEYKTKS